ncbi:MAG: hypothetical protein ABH952_01475 [Candidatus Omnitrophota bacterium]
MISKALENKIQAVEEYLELWLRFHDLYKEVTQTQVVNPTKEKEFMDLKSLLTRKYQGLLDTLNIQLTTEDRTFDVVSQLLSLKDVINISELQMQKIETEWHNSYISLNKMLGSLENRKTELANISHVKVIINKIFSGPLVSLLSVIIAIIIFYLIYTKFFNY